MYGGKVLDFVSTVQTDGSTQHIIVRTISRKVRNVVVRFTGVKAGQQFSKKRKICFFYVE